MSELEGITSMARLEMELFKDGTKAAIDISKFGWRRILDAKKFVMWLQYHKVKGDTNAKNLMQKTNHNVMMVQMPDECQKDFEKFCSKNGILCSKMFDFNKADGYKQYMFDANMSDLVYQYFTREISVKYGSQFTKAAEEMEEKIDQTKQELSRNEEKQKEFSGIYERMKEGQIQNEVDDLAKAMGYQDAQDAEFLDYMKDKCSQSGTGAYMEEAKRQMEQWENWKNVKKRELKEQIYLQERLEKKAKNPVHPITYEDYINTNKCSMEEFEENLQRMAEDEECPVYENMDITEALRQDTPLQEEPEKIKEIDKQDYIYNSKNPDTVIVRNYYKEIVNGEEVGCYHVLECEKDGKRYSLSDRGLGQKEYQDALENFLEQIGMEQESKVMVLSNYSELEHLMEIDRQVAEEPPIPVEVMHPDKGMEYSSLENYVEGKQREELQEQLKEQSAKEYTDTVTKEMVYQDPSDPNRVRIPIMMEDGDYTWMVEIPKESLTPDGKGNIQVHFNGTDQLRAYELSNIADDSTLIDETAYLMITGKEFHTELQEALGKTADKSAKEAVEIKETVGKALSRGR